MVLINEICGCGKPVRYTRIIDGVEHLACNKYQRCPTYDELLQQVRQLRIELHNYEVKFDKIKEVNDILKNI